MDNLLLRFTFIPGLRDVVLDELSLNTDIHILEKGDDDIYISNVSNITPLFTLRSVSNVYLVKRDIKINPRYISNHKSILGDLIERVIQKNKKSTFQTFKLRCAGSDSEESLEIQDFITKTYKLIKAEDADLEIYINKPGDTWEVGVRFTPRPLSIRDYKVEHLKGGINPTVAYVMNTFAELDSASSYLNIFSGSATLLIEAALSNPELKLIGFDIEGKSNALAVKNIKKAGKIKKIHLKTADIFDKPDLGTFDVITSDLPFGMQIGKGNDLEKLYQTFINYCESVLNPGGRLILYTTEIETLDLALKESKFIVTKNMELKIPTSVGSFLHPKIFVCKFR